MPIRFSHCEPMRDSRLGPCGRATGETGTLTLGGAAWGGASLGGATWGGPASGIEAGSGADSGCHAPWVEEAADAGGGGATAFEATVAALPCSSSKTRAVSARKTSRISASSRSTSESSSIGLRCPDLRTVESYRILCQTEEVFHLGQSVSEQLQSVDCSPLKDQSASRTITSTAHR